jgi:hypothetical protein
MVARGHDLQQPDNEEGEETMGRGMVVPASLEAGHDGDDENGAPRSAYWRGLRGSFL